MRKNFVFFFFIHLQTANSCRLDTCPLLLIIINNFNRCTFDSCRSLNLYSLIFEINFEIDCNWLQEGDREFRWFLIFDKMPRIRSRIYVFRNNKLQCLIIAMENDYIIIYQLSFFESNCAWAVIVPTKWRKINVVKNIHVRYVTHLVTNLYICYYYVYSC